MSDHLDTLMLSYLDALDTYQSLRASLSAHFTAGFLALAQARFHSASQQRFGADCYDERMKALHGVLITTTDSDTDSDGGGGGVVFAHRSMETGPDPLRWFGILVPRALREAQCEFSAAVVADVGALVTAAARVAEMEVRVRRARTRFLYRVWEGEEGGGEDGDGDVWRVEEVRGRMAGMAGMGKVWVRKIPYAGVEAEVEWEGEGGGLRLVGGEGEVRGFEKGEEPGAWLE